MPKYHKYRHARIMTEAKCENCEWAHFGWQTTPVRGSETNAAAVRHINKNPGHIVLVIHTAKYEKPTKEN